MDTISTPAPFSPLHQRMQHDMMMRGLLPRTQDQYIRRVRRFSAYLGRPPDTATAENLRNFQIHQHESGASAGTINGAGSALRFLYTVTLRRRAVARGLIATRRPDKMREILSVEEATRLLEAALGIKYKAELGVAYGEGPRVSEVAHLKVDDIDSERMLIRVEQGKGAHDRNTMLSPHLLHLLRLWWREGKRRRMMFPHGWLFKTASETVLTIAADPKHLGARIGITAVLHSWGSAMTHHPHVHIIVPGGGIAHDGKRWIASQPALPNSIAPSG